MKEEIVENIGKEIKEKKKLPEEIQKKINKRVFENILIATVIMLFFIFIRLGYINIEKSIFITDLKVFSIGILAIAIILFENSYKNDNGKLCAYGIETLCLAIVTLFSVYICIMLGNVFLLLIPTFSYVFAIYYVGKCIYVYNKMKKEYIKSLSDISEIIKEEKPIKKAETRKRKKVEAEESKKKIKK